MAECYTWSYICLYFLSSHISCIHLDSELIAAINHLLLWMHCSFSCTLVFILNNFGKFGLHTSIPMLSNYGSNNLHVKLSHIQIIIINFYTCDTKYEFPDRIYSALINALNDYISGFWPWNFWSLSSRSC